MARAKLSGPNRTGWWLVDGSLVLVVWCREVGEESPGLMCQVTVATCSSENPDPVCNEWELMHIWPSHFEGEWEFFRKDLEVAPDMPSQRLRVS